MSDPILIVKNISKYFGGIKALEKVSLSVPENSIIGLIGPNGSGKTTLFNVVTGFYVPDGGEVYFKVNDDYVRIDGLNPHEVFKMGIVRTFQIPRLFPSLTVLENMLVTPINQIGEKLINSIRFRVWNKEEEMLARKALDILKEFGKLDIADKRPSEISVADVKLIETLRGLMTPARLYLLDEPLAGLDIPTAYKLLEFVKDLRARYKLTFLIVEHRIDLLLGAVDYVYVLHNGKLLSSGKPEEVMKDPRVIKAYVGE